MKAKFTYNGKMKAIYCLIISFCSLFAHANDLDMFCLKGPVDSVCIVMNDAGLEWQNEYVFDEQGNLIELDGEEFICERDADGRMKSVLLEDAVEDDEEKFTTIEMTLSYNRDGRVDKVVSTAGDETWTRNYRYNEKGLLKERDYDTSGDDEKLTYVYYKFDDHGNWTERLEKLGSMDQTIRQIRNITYRK